MLCRPLDAHYFACVSASEASGQCGTGPATCTVPLQPSIVDCQSPSQAVPQLLRRQ
jgi:hypothetical protein